MKVYESECKLIVLLHSECNTFHKIFKDHVNCFSVGLLLPLADVYIIPRLGIEHKQNDTKIVFFLKGGDFRAFFGVFLALWRSW